MCVFKAGVDLNTPSNSTQPMRPNKELLQLEVLHAVKESWLQALHAASPTLHTQQDEAEAACLKAEHDTVAQASRQALLSDLQRASTIENWQPSGKGGRFTFVKKNSGVLDSNSTRLHL